MSSNVEKKKRKMKKISVGIAENLIIAKLEKDGIIKVDNDNKKVVIDMRASSLAPYKKESIQDIQDILRRLSIGFKKMEWDVTTKCLEA
jgi:hypothetical protein